MKETLKYLKPCGGTIALALIFKFAGTVAELFLPILLRYIMNEAVPSDSLRGVLICGALMLLCSVLALVGNIIANRLSVNVSGRMTHDLRADLFAKITYLKCGQVDAFGTPSLISRLTSDTYYVNQMVARTIRMGVRAPILLTGGIILTFIIDPVLACVLLACVPFVAVALYFITGKSIPMYSAVQKKGDVMVRAMQENAAGIRVIKALSRTDYESEKFENISEELAKTELKANKIMSLSNPVATLILNLGLVGVIAAGAARGSEGGTVLAFLTYFTIILNAMLGISKIFVIISRGAASAERISTVLVADCSEEISDIPPENDGYKIRFKDVSFSYGGKKDNLMHADFGVKAGQTLGIIGATGSGKSTIVNLLMRFYDADSGSVQIDGRDVRSYDGGTLRSKFGVAFQSDFLMSSTVRENVAYGRELSDEEIDRALENAGAKEFVDRLDGGKDFVLAQKGANLSGGQKQRLIIARALAGQPEILVLDDSSSALDYATDAKLRRALAREYAQVTKVIIAQRISSVKSADLILVLDDGRIIGAGGHDYLLQNCDEYAKIYDAQMGGEEYAA